MLKVVAGSSTALGILGRVVVLGALAAGTLAAQAAATSAPAAAAPGSRDPQTLPALIVNPPADAVDVEKHPPAWAYHETLIPNTAKKPLRIWLEVGSRDNGFRPAEDTYRNWPLANNRMAEALKAKGRKSGSDGLK